MKLTLGFSPCPNDTFIFDALVNNKIDTDGLLFDVVLEDVQTLNKWALQQKLQFSKISYGVLPLILNNYKVLNSGGALGSGVGPLLIAKKIISFQDVSGKTVAIPGENTTAHLLFSLAFSNVKNKKFVVFNEVENLVLDDKVDAGVIIHENRFTYANKGLHKIIDLGEYWENQLHVPIPLGGIVAHNSVDANIKIKVDNLIRKSIEYAFKKNTVTDYIKCNAQEMSEDVMLQHINLYVNNYSLQLGDIGKKAVIKLIEVYNKINDLDNSLVAENIFI